MTSEEARCLALRADLVRNWEMVREHLARARSVSPAAGAPEASHVALSLDHAYQAFETLLVRLERALGLAPRIGAGWHAALLDAAGRELPGLRDAVFPPSARDDWAALLGFRHFLRHAYLVELDANKLATNTVRLERAVAATAASVQALVAAVAVPPSE